MKKNKKIVKGLPSAVVLSILIHAGLFLLAGVLMVFTVEKKEEKKFVPPKAVERPKMKLRKPKVKVKKTSKPKPTTRITTKVNRATFPDIQLPEMSGVMTDGLVGGIGGFDMMPDLGEISVFGSGQSIGSDLVGTFYDFKYDSRGHPRYISVSEYENAMRKFVKTGFKASEFARYKHSPKKLYTTTIMAPTMPSTFGPIAFGEDTLGSRWAVVYRGELVHKEGITFRFWGHGDNILVVRVNGELVLNACWPGMDTRIVPQWQSSSADSRKYWLGNNRSAVGDWITLEPGVSLNMEVLIGELGGGGFAAMLLVEEQGVEYIKNSRGAPILPIFKTAEPSRDLIETIYAYLVEGEACVTNGSVFCDYDSHNSAKSSDTNETVSSSFHSELFKSADAAEMRIWIGLDGRTLEAEFLAIIGDKVVLKDSRGGQRKVPLAQLSEEDRMFIELACPPKFNITFSKQSSKRHNKANPYTSWIPPTILDYVFTAKLKQKTAGTYNHELHIESFAIGEEVDGDNYILFDRQESSFVPSAENERSFKLSGHPVELMNYEFYGQRRGAKYGGYLVVVTDSRGKIIDYGTSHKWLLDIFENLRTFPVGKHFDKTGRRVYPPRPKRYFY